MDAMAWEERFRPDVWYADNWSLALDFRIPVMSVGRVLRSEGISAKGCATMPEFLGTKESGSH